MKRILACCFMGFFMVCWPVCAPASDLVAQADRLYDQGGLQNYKEAIALYLKAIDQSPQDYEALWKCARAYRDYGDEAKKQDVAGWKEICAEYGKLGMQYAKQAIELEPDKPDGHYYYGLSVGVYSDGVSILTALSEGLKDKTQSSFEKTYEIDKMYNDGGPMISLGRFWAVLPWPMRDRKKALQYYREYQTTEYYATNEEAQLFLAELLSQMGGADNKKEAKDICQKVAQSNDPYFKNWAEDLLAEL